MDFFLKKNGILVIPLLIVDDIVLKEKEEEQRFLRGLNGGYLYLSLSLSLSLSLAKRAHLICSKSSEIVIIKTTKHYLSIYLNCD